MRSSSILRAAPWRVAFTLVLMAGAASLVSAAQQEESVRPDINRNYKDPELNVEEQDKAFSSENRETYANRQEITAAIGLKPGMIIADVGAGTGIYEPMLSKAVGPKGKVIAVDISQPFLDLIASKMKEDKITNVETLLGDDKSTHLPPKSVDVVFTSDVYHHFEYPQTILLDIRDALKEDGVFIVVDYDRLPGVTPPGRMSHVRTDKKTVIAEVTEAGFQPPEEVKIPGLKESFFLKFKK